MNIRTEKYILKQNKPSIRVCLQTEQHQSYKMDSSIQIDKFSQGKFLDNYLFIWH